MSSADPAFFSVVHHRKKMQVAHKMYRFSSIHIPRISPHLTASNECQSFCLSDKCNRKLSLGLLFYLRVNGDATTPSGGPPSTFHDCPEIWRSNSDSNFLGPLFSPFIHRHPCSSILVTCVLNMLRGLIFLWFWGISQRALLIML